MDSRDNRKKFTKPVVNLIVLDYTISLVMKSHKDPKPPKPPKGHVTAPQDPFASPFGDRAFD